MTAISAVNNLSDEETVRLKAILARDFVAHLPPLAFNTRSAADNVTKNLSRAFGGFVVAHLRGVDAATAAKSVVDDYDDGGIDAVYMHEPTDTLLIVQVKLRTGAEFQQGEAQNFTAGVRRLLAGELNGFNTLIQIRSLELEDILDRCTYVQLVVASIGSGVSVHARAEIDRLTRNAEQDEKRLVHPFIDFGPAKIRAAMDGHMAHPAINAKIKVMKCKQISEPRETWFGVVRVSDLIGLYEKHDDGLFDKNLRNPLGDKTDVNKAIAQSLRDNPAHFFYMNNGVTILAKQIDAKAAKADGQTLDLRGLSVINGAQTIAAATRFKRANPGTDISQAKVAITMIFADADGEFGKAVTKARNHQNPVQPVDFVALEDEQERLRREMRAHGIRYAYKAQDIGPVVPPDTITIAEAAHALALLDHHPRSPWLLKSKPEVFRIPGKSEYRRIFPVGLASNVVINAVYVARYLNQYIFEQVRDAPVGVTKEALRHALFVHSWVLAKRARGQIKGSTTLDPVKISTSLSLPADALRQTIIDLTQNRMNGSGKLAWTLYRNQSELFGMLESIMVEHYGNSNPQAIAANRARVEMRQGARGRSIPANDYPKALFDYLCECAPQIGSLA